MKKKQGNLCALSGQKMLWKAKSGAWQASIDRIDNKKGYTKNNIQLVGFAVNQARNNLDISEFIELCKKIINHQHSGNKKTQNVDVDLELEYFSPMKTRKKGGKVTEKEYKCSDCNSEITKYSKTGKCVKCAAKDRGFSRRTVIRPKIEDLKEMIKDIGYSATGRFYNVSDNTIRKWIS